LSLSLMSQNRNNKSSSSNETCGSFLFWHRPDARVALQQSPILQNDIDRVMEMDYNRKSKLVLRSVLRSELLRPFTQLTEQTHLTTRFCSQWSRFLITKTSIGNDSLSLTEHSMDSLCCQLSIGNSGNCI